MSKYLIEDTTLTDIANAIRTKTGNTASIKTNEMANEITNISSGGGGGGLGPEDLTFTDSLRYAFTGDTWNWIINQYGNQITTKNVSDCKSMFQNNSITKIPFNINCNKSSRVFIDNMFNACSNLKELPRIYNLMVALPSGGVFDGCNRVNNIPEDYCDTWDWSVFDTATSAYTSNTIQSYMFRGCYSLRHIPEALYTHCNPYRANSDSVFYFGFADCYVLEELTNLPTYEKTTWTSDAFMRTFREHYRNKKITFRLQEDGSPVVVQWRYQNIDLSDAVGYAKNAGDITLFNSGLKADTRITDDATYQALKDSPDSWTTDINYSRYNRTSAVETINSLPDASAYLASLNNSGYYNTIKFKGESGALTDGGAINTMTEAEIAVATAKGWTVSFA